MPEYVSWSVPFGFQQSMHVLAVGTTEWIRYRFWRLMAVSAALWRERLLVVSCLTATHRLTTAPGMNLNNKRNAAQ